VASLTLTTLAIFLAVKLDYMQLVGVVAFVPCLVFVAVGAGPIVGAMWADQKYRSRLDPEGIYCLNCLYDVRGSVDSKRCPECGTSIPFRSLQRGVGWALPGALRMALRSFLYSLLGTVVGYLVMLPFLGGLFR
jgi:hypothetical protein